MEGMDFNTKEGAPQSFYVNNDNQYQYEDISIGGLPTILPIPDFEDILHRAVDTIPEILRTSVFCTFMATWRWMVEPDLPEVQIKLRDRANTVATAVSKKWCMAFEFKYDETPTVVKVLCHRIVIAEELMEQFRLSKNHRERFCLQLFIDEHLDLFLEILDLLDSSKTEDCCITIKDVLNDENMIGLGGLVYAFMPDKYRVPSCHTLPDIVSFVRFSNMKYEVIPETPKFLYALCHIISKATNHNCLPRNTSDILKMYACKFPVIETLIRSFIQVSLLGNYPESSVRPPFATRLHIRRSFRIDTCSKSLFDWIEKHDKLVRYTIREFYAFCMSFLPMVETRLMGKWCNWQISKSFIHKAMDSARTCFLHAAAGYEPFHLKNTNFIEGWRDRTLINSLFKEAILLADENVEREHDSSLEYNHKLFKDNWISLFLTRLVDKHKTVWHYSDTSKLNYLVYATEMAEISGCSIHLIERILDCASEAERYLSLDGGGNFEVTKIWLKILGMSETSIDNLEQIHTDYTFESSSISDNSLGNILNASISNSTDRTIMLCYFNKVHGDICTHVYQLPDEIKQAQIKALRNKLELMPWQPLPPGAGDCAYCPRCESWRTPVAGYPQFYSLERKGKKGSSLGEISKYIHSNGIENVMLDMNTKKLHCKKKGQSISSKKRKLKLLYEDKGMLLSDEQVETLLKEKEGYLNDGGDGDDGGSRRAERTCCSYPIEMINLLGKAIKLKKCTYLLCCYCSTLTYLPTKTTNDLVYPSCGMHLNLGGLSINNIESLSDIPRALDIAYPEVMVFNKISSPKDILASNPTNTENRMISAIDNPVIYHNLSRRCFYCYQSVKEIDMKLIYIIDDTRNFCVYPHILCKKDYNFSYVYRRFNVGNVFLKSLLLKTISKYKEKNLCRRILHY